MSQPNILVDNKALEMNRKRAIGRDEYFLHELAIAEIKDRLSSMSLSGYDISTQLYT